MITSLRVRVGLEDRQYLPSLKEWPEAATFPVVVGKQRTLLCLAVLGGEATYLALLGRVDVDHYCCTSENRDQRFLEHL